MGAGALQTTRELPGDLKRAWQRHLNGDKENPRELQTWYLSVKTLGSKLPTPYSLIKINKFVNRWQEWVCWGFTKDKSFQTNLIPFFDRITRLVARGEQHWMW